MRTTLVPCAIALSAAALAASLASPPAFAEDSAPR
jgi:hypothetical protein